jgi:hypothetical protein
VGEGQEDTLLPLSKRVSLAPLQLQLAAPRVEKRSRCDGDMGQDACAHGMAMTELIVKITARARHLPNRHLPVHALGHETWGRVSTAAGENWRREIIAMTGAYLQRLNVTAAPQQTGGGCQGGTGGDADFKGECG